MTLLPFCGLNLWFWLCRLCFSQDKYRL